MGSENVIKVKSFEFAIRIVKLYKYLCDSQKEFILSKQLLRSGTSIGANIAEALEGQSTRDFLMKMNISLKEASETTYWLRLLHATDYLNDKEFNSIYKNCAELQKLLTAIVKTTVNKIETEEKKRCRKGSL